MGSLTKNKTRMWFGSIVCLLSFCSLTACKQEKQGYIASAKQAAKKTKLSAPFLVIDFEGNGIDLIPLEVSNVYSDVDGDGLAEKTAWVKPSDGFVGILSRTEDMKVSEKRDRVVVIFQNGIEKVKSFDRNKDSVYDEMDYVLLPRNKKFSELAFYISRDKELEGLPKGNVLCKLNSVKYAIGDKKDRGVLSCADKDYPFVEVRFEYEDSNVLWKGYCDSMRFGRVDYDEYQKNCLDHGHDAWKGYDPRKQN